MFGNGNFPWIAKFSRFHKTLNQNLVTFWSAGSDYTAHYSYILTTAQRYCKVHYDLKDVHAVNISVKDTVLECTECTLRTLFLPECARGACDIMNGMYTLWTLCLPECACGAGDINDDGLAGWRWRCCHGHENWSGVLSILVLGQYPAINQYSTISQGRFWTVERILPFLSNHPGAIHPILQNRHRQKS